MISLAEYFFWHTAISKGYPWREEKKWVGRNVDKCRECFNLARISDKKKFRRGGDIPSVSLMYFTNYISVLTLRSLSASLPFVCGILAKPQFEQINHLDVYFHGWVSGLLISYSFWLRFIECVRFSEDPISCSLCALCFSIFWFTFLRRLRVFIIKTFRFKDLFGWHRVKPWSLHSRLVFGCSLAGRWYAGRHQHSDCGSAAHRPALLT